MSEVTAFELRALKLVDEGRDDEGRPEVHVHGELVWRLGARTVPGMAAAPGDVCLDEWWDTLEDAAELLEEGDGSLVVDPGREGLPAFILQRDGGSLSVSVVEGEGGGQEDPAFQQVATSWEGFLAAVAQLQQAARPQLLALGPALPDGWRERLWEPDQGPPTSRS